LKHILLQKQKKMLTALQECCTLRVQSEVEVSSEHGFRRELIASGRCDAGRKQETGGIQMKKRTGIMILAGVCVAGLAQAALIASESFWTTNGTPANSEYKQGNLGGTNVGGYNNSVVTAGNSGFTADNPWSGNTSAIAAQTDFNLNHSGMAGTARDGSVRLNVQTGTTGDRQSNRLATSVPEASSYYMSALVRGTTPQQNGNTGTIGFMSSISGNTFDISSGIHVGLHVAGGELHLAAFANNTTYNLVNLSTVGLTTIHQVVLRLDVNASGNDALSVWYAKDGDVGLTQVVSNQDVGNIWASSADLDTLAIQVKTGGATAIQTLGYIDEMRFGTTLQDVTTIPEPATLGLFTLSSAALLLARRCLTR